MTKLFFTVFFHFLLVIHLPSLLAESSVEIRTAAFFPSASLFKDIYGDVGVSYQIEASTKFYNFLDGWGNVDWFSKQGRSDGGGNSTKIEIANFSFGIKFPYQFNEFFTAYLGIGPSFAKVWVKDNTPCGSDKTSKWAVGGVLKTGVYYFITNSIFLDLFVDYLYQQVHFSTHVNIGGFKTGAGIGMKF